MRLLRQGQDLLKRHPETARLILQSLVVEGRRFAQTAEGQKWKSALARSEFVRRGRLIWQAYGLDELVGARPGPALSDWLELVASALADADLETILSVLMKESAPSVSIQDFP